MAASVASSCQQPFRVAAPAMLRTHLFRPAAGTRVQRRHLQVVAALQDPWSTLGVPRNATEKEVKKAHRHLVKQHHPDVKTGDPLAHARFIRIQEAYEILTGKLQGKDLDSCPSNKSSWSFHDWYWSFSIKRRVGKGKGAAAFTGAAGGAEAPPTREQWRAQMAGLRQKAAAKRGQQAGRRQARGAPGFGADGGDVDGSHAAGARPAAAADASESQRRESTWRSMTKNARASPAQAATAAAASAWAGQELRSSGATAGGLGEGAGASSEPQKEHVQPQAGPGASPAAAVAPEPQTAKVHARPAANEVPLHSTHAATEAAAPAGAADEAAHMHAGARHAQRLQRLLEHAASVVHRVQRDADDAAGADSAAHAAQAGRERLGEVAAAAAAGWGRHLRGRQALEQLFSMLLSGARADGEQGHVAGNAVPADSALHRLFSATRRARQQPQHHHSAAAAEALNSAAEQPASQHHIPLHHYQQHQLQHEHEQKQDEQQQPQHGPYRGASHSRKFANRDEVEGRLNSQLAGLKRRAALKQEVESTC